MGIIHLVTLELHPTGSIWEACVNIRATINVADFSTEFFPLVRGEQIGE